MRAEPSPTPTSRFETGSAEPWTHRRFGTDAFTRDLGYAELEHEGRPLPPFEDPHLERHGIALHSRLFELLRWSDRARELGERFRDLWETRVELGRPRFPGTPAATLNRFLFSAGG